MQFTNSFDVPLAPAQAWAFLMDIERIAPCMPGAELTDVVDADTYKGKVSLRLGPVALAFAGTAKFEERNAAAYQARVKAQGADAKGRGGANAMVGFRLEPSAEGSKVVIDTDLALSGAIAQYGRASGMIQNVASALIQQFAANLRQKIAESGIATSTVDVAPAPSTEATAATSVVMPAPSPVAAPRPPDPVKPISGFSLLFGALWQSLRGLFGRR